MEKFRNREVSKPKCHTLIQGTPDNLEIQTNLPHQIQQRVSLVGEQGGEEEEGVSWRPGGGHFKTTSKY